MNDGTKPRHVSVVDDDEGVCDSTCVLLDLHGFDATPYLSADSFLQGSASKSTDCLVLDMEMPDMGGVELLELLRSRNIQTPAIMVTGSGELYKERTDRAMAFATLNKPFIEEDFVRAVHLACAAA